MTPFQKVNWKPRDLVGPTPEPNLTDLEARIDAALVTHRHGYVLKHIGSTPVYEAAPLDPRYIPIVDPLNPANETLFDHMADAELHREPGDINPQPIKIFTTSINLMEEHGGFPDYDEGSISWSWVTDAQMITVKPAQSRTYVTGPDYYNNFFPIWSQGRNQTYLFPTPFVNSPPIFGRVLQPSNLYLSSNLVLDDQGATPNIIAYDYILFPYASWYNLFRARTNSNQLMQTSSPVKRYRTLPFPNGYRVQPGALDQVRVQHQLRAGLTHTYGAGDPFDELYWPNDMPLVNDDGTPVGSLDYTVPAPGAYDVDPANPNRDFTAEPNYRIRPGLQPDFSNFEAAVSPGGYRTNVWEQMKLYPYGNFGYGPYTLGDALMPFDVRKRFSLRLLYEMHNDNQLDLFPLVMCGFMVMLPFGYLPLYVPDDFTLYDGIFGGGTSLLKTAANYMRSPLEFAPAGSQIYFQDGMPRARAADAGPWFIQMAQFDGIAPDYVAVSGDQRAHFPNGRGIYIKDYPPNAGPYTVRSTTYPFGGGLTQIRLNQSLNVETMGGSGYVYLYDGPPQYAYPYPKEIMLDCMIQIPEGD